MSDERTVTLTLTLTEAELMLPLKAVLFRTDHGGRMYYSTPVLEALDQAGISEALAAEVVKVYREVVVDPATTERVREAVLRGITDAARHKAETLVKGMKREDFEAKVLPLLDGLAQ